MTISNLSLTVSLQSRDFFIVGHQNSAHISQKDFQTASVCDLSKPALSLRLWYVSHVIYIQDTDFVEQLNCDQQ